MLLNSLNVFDYLSERDFCHSLEQDKSKVEPLAAKNFNLLVTLSDKPNGQRGRHKGCDGAYKGRSNPPTTAPWKPTATRPGERADRRKTTGDASASRASLRRKLLVKQERHNLEGKAAGEFRNEYRIQEWLQQFSLQKSLGSFLPELLHFDASNSIIVFRYLDDYRDLMDFYVKESNFPTEISRAIGTLLATIHRDTYDREEYQQFFENRENSQAVNRVPQLIKGLERIKPEIFAAIPADGLKFFALYQRYDSLGSAIAELGNAYTPSSLTHNDLKLNNILLHTDWQQTDDSIIRLIDWERCSWGDPAFDLGTLIASYIQIWLGSLVISKSLSIEESLSLAITPLEQLQPSIAALTKAYLETFPEILEHRPDFLQRVVQFAGFALIQQIQAMIQYQKSFGNTGIAMLQVAKSLLCRPERSMPTLFGRDVIEIVQLCTAT